MQVANVNVPNNFISSLLTQLNNNFSVSGTAQYIDIYSLGWLLFFFTLMIYLISKEQWLRLRKELHHQAMNDQLTHLPNRRLFADRTEQLLKTSKRQRKGFALILADLDYFKLINDSLGHHAGDIVLKELATRFSALIRGGDTVARLGGDEFAFLIQDVNCFEDIEPVLQRIYSALEEPIGVEDRSFNIGISFGVTFFPQHSMELEGLLRRADISLYRAKEERNTYKVYTNEEDEALGLKNIAKHNDLRKNAS